MEHYFKVCESRYRLYYAENVGVCSECGNKIKVEIDDDKEGAIKIKCDNCPMYWELKWCPENESYNVKEYRWEKKK
jgi:hypothetical protein